MIAEFEVRRYHGRDDNPADKPSRGLGESRNSESGGPLQEAHDPIVQ
jgi:hypothetical protein